MTAIGPQSPNYSTTRPTSDTDVETANDTWLVDCTAAGANDGTVITELGGNAVEPARREAIRDSGITLDNTNDKMLYQAIQAAVQQWWTANVTASEGIRIVGNDIQSNLGDGIRTQLAVPGDVDPVNDLWWVYDASATAHVESNIYNAVAAVLAPNTDAVFNGTTGTITLSKTGNLTIASTPPGTPALTDLWYDTDDDILYQRVNDGTTDFWLDIST